VIVAIFAKEAPAYELVNFLKRERPALAQVSVWGIAEFAAATSFKFIQGSIDAELRESARLNFVSAQRTLFNIVAVETHDYFRAANFANNYNLRLRGGDALHLGVASRLNVPVLTLDNRMKSAAQALGIGVIDLA
jgi:uncharacterized protein